MRFGWPALLLSFVAILPADHANARATGRATPLLPSYVLLQTNGPTYPHFQAASELPARKTASAVTTWTFPQLTAEAQVHRR
jgi:hypothetical protein